MDLIYFFSYSRLLGKKKNKNTTLHIQYSMWNVTNGL